MTNVQVPMTDDDVVLVIGAWDLIRAISAIRN